MENWGSLCVKYPSHYRNDRKLKPAVPLLGGYLKEPEVQAWTDRETDRHTCTHARVRTHPPTHTRTFTADLGLWKGSEAIEIRKCVGKWAWL